MAQPTKVRTYGRKARTQRLVGPVAESRKDPKSKKGTSREESLEDHVKALTEQLDLVTIHDHETPSFNEEPTIRPAPESSPKQAASTKDAEAHDIQQGAHAREGLRVLTWDDVCPLGDKIEKIAEASYAEVYRVTNDRGTSIIKCIRLDSPIKPQTKTQKNCGLVDEEPHEECDLEGELQISEWLADIPGFVVYKERYIVQGKATHVLLETHQTFHRKIKRKDPDRLQFYPSPSRYLNDTKFLVVELGDAGTALEDQKLVAIEQLWDIFLHVAVALARAESLVKFEHRDLHEGNLCINQVDPPRDKDDASPCRFGYSGLEVTILDYGLSRAEDTQRKDPTPVSYDLEKDLSLFTSTHAGQCKVYRQMRSFLLKGDRVHLPPKYHQVPHEKGVDGPISWRQYSPYTNVLWLAYLYEYLARNYHGAKKDLVQFKAATRELWAHLDPDAPPEILSFSCATDIVEYAVEAGWITEGQLMGQADDDQGPEVPDESHNASIIEVRAIDVDEAHPRRSPRRRRLPPTG